MSVKAAANGFHGRLRVALSDGITPSRLPALLVLLPRGIDPEFEIRLFEVPLAQQLSGLRDDLYDVGFSMADRWATASSSNPPEDELMVAMPRAMNYWPTRRYLDEVLQHPWCWATRQFAKAMPNRSTHPAQAGPGYDRTVRRHVRR